MPEMQIVKSAPRCSACYDQKPKERHVDFNVAYEGPVISVAEQPVPIDDLVICESCLIRAAKLIGLSDPYVLRERLAAAEAQRDAAEEQLAAQVAYARRLEGTIAAKPEPKKRQTRQKAVAA